MPLGQLGVGDVVAEAVGGGVVGDRQVGVAASSRGLGHLRQRVSPVGKRGVGVEIALQVVDPDQVGELAARGRGDLATALAKLRLDVGEADALVDLGLGGVLGDVAALDLHDPVLGDREAHLHGALPQLDVVLGRAGEVLEEVSVGLRRDDPQVHLDAVVGHQPRSGLARGCPTAPPARARWRPRPAPSRPWRWRSGRCPCRSPLGAAPSPPPPPRRLPGAREGPAPAPRPRAGRRRAAAARRGRRRRASPAPPGRSPPPSGRGPSSPGSSGPPPPPAARRGR